jgi:hypothetical protein
VNTSALPAVESRTAVVTSRTQLPLLVPVLLMLASVALWVWGLPRIELRDMTDLGLVSVLPVSMLAALALLATSFCLCLRSGGGVVLRIPRRVDLRSVEIYRDPGDGRPVTVVRLEPHVEFGRSVHELVLLAHVLLLIFMFYGLPSIVEDVPRLSATWRHAGVIEYIGRTGDVDPTIDAYFNWPGFFISGAFLVDLAGLDSALGIARWAPVFFNLIFIGPLLVIFRTATSDKRLVWLGIWFFYLTNWVSQDYFAPQAFGFFLYLVVVASLLRWFGRTDPGPSPLRSNPSGSKLARFVQRLPGRTAWNSPAPGIVTTLSPARRTGLLAVVIVLIAAIVPSHQLTPFAALAGVTALVAFNRCQARGLPLLTAVLIGTWMIFMAAAYLAGNLGDLLSQIGQLGTAVEANVGARVGGSTEHLLVVYMRLLLAGALWTIALVGGIRAFRHGRPYSAYALLALAPFPLMALQPYGGEMLLRVYLFSLPFMVLFAASLFFPTSKMGRSWMTTASLGVVSLALLGSLFVSRYGNERMEYFTSQEASAVEQLYKVARPESLLVAGTRNFPRNFRDYEKFDYEWVVERPDWKLMDPAHFSTAAVVRALEESMASRGTRDSYVIITRSQKAEVSLMGLGPRGSLDRFERDLAASSQFKLVYANEDAKIFAFTGNREPVGS